MQRLGLFTGIAKKRPEDSRIWVHALSVGEVNSSVPFVDALKKKYPSRHIVFTASTKTGFERAQVLMGPENKNSPVSEMGYFPFDIWCSAIAVISRISPDLVCLVETDLWPGFLSLLKQKNIPVVLFNARLSPRSFKGYQRLGKFSGMFFSNLSHIMTQTRQDAERFETLGVDKKRLLVTGNIKFDQPCIELTKEESNKLSQDLGITPDQRVWVAGSTHKGEEILVFKAFDQVRKSSPELKLIIAPRDPNRCPDLIRELPISVYKVSYYSDNTNDKNGSDILFLDTIGVLARAYGLCELAFIGGSMVPLGGHNPLEAAMFAKPVLFGPNMTDFFEVADLLVDGDGALQVEDGPQLTKRVAELLDDGQLCERMGQAAQKVFLSNSGALDRVIEKVEDFLD